MQKKLTVKLDEETPAWPFIVASIQESLPGTKVLLRLAEVTVAVLQAVARSQIRYSKVSVPVKSGFES